MNFNFDFEINHPRRYLIPLKNCMIHKTGTGGIIYIININFFSPVSVSHCLSIVCIVKIIAKKFDF